jgi:predicted PurR-regulated permease PerM
VSAGAIVGLIFAIFFALGVCFFAFVLVRLAEVLKETTKLVAGITQETVPLLNEITDTVKNGNSQLVKVDAITDNVETMSKNISGLVGTATSVVGGPLVKVASFSYGVRAAITTRKNEDVAKRVKAELKADRRARRLETKNDQKKG